MVHNFGLMSQSANLDVQGGMRVNLPTGDQVSISHIGESLILKDKVVKDVLFVPEFKYNLLAVSQLTKQLKCAVVFFPDFCIFQDLFNGRVLGIGKENQGLYILNTPVTTKPSNDQVSSGECAKEAAYKRIRPISFSSTADSLSSLWHKRLGHAPLKVLSRIKELNIVSVHEHHCSICPIAKQSRLPFPTSLSHSSSIFDIIHGDVWGPYRVPNHDGKRYFLTLVDDMSRYTWIFLLYTKSDTVVVLKDFVNLVRNQFGVGIKCIRTDNGKEFFNNQMDDLFKDNGIIQ